MKQKFSTSAIPFALLGLVHFGLSALIHSSEEINQTVSNEDAVFIKGSLDESSKDNLFLINKRAHMLENLYEGDIQLNPFRNAHGNKWPKSRDGLVRIPVEISWTGKDRATIRSALREFHKHTCVRFPPRTNEVDHLFVQNGFSCSSLVGKSTSGRQLITLGNIFGNCITRGTIIHEFMHAIGFLHEQSRSDRDNYIQVVEENTHHANSINLRKFDDTTNLVIYDYYSVMHYSRYGLGREVYLPPLREYPKRPTSQKIRFGNKGRFSPYDIEEIKYYYECGPQTFQRCGRDFLGVTSGLFRSPSYPRNYPADAHCTWRIRVQRGRYVEVKFRNVEMERSNDCVSDSLIIHDGRNASAPLLNRVCGSQGSLDVTSTGNNIFIMFSSDSDNHYKGFRATFREVRRPGSTAPPIPTAPPVPAITSFARSFRCSFNDRGLCGMTQDSTDDLSFFHTGNDIQLQSFASTGDSAIIRSPWFSSDRQLCVRFRYLMHGGRMGGLRVYTYEKIQSKQKGNDNLLWEKLGSQQNGWINGQVTYTPSSDVEYLQFYWEASFWGSTPPRKIDDISITPDACELVKNTSCDFETGLCEFYQVRGDQFDWTRRRGATLTRETGPSRDHTSGNGYYMHIDASPPRSRGDVARLGSPRLTDSSHCFSLWYHMNGTDTGNLTIFERTSKGLVVMEKIVGNQGDDWKLLQINLRSTATQSNKNSDEFKRVIIEARVGSGSKGDIAIDDVRITNRKCVPPPALNFSCDFETDDSLCNMVQSKADQFDWTRHKGSTPTRGTGPSEDNTKGTADGYYIYIEASQPQKRNDVARLATPRLTSGRYCLRFAYHMFGSGIGELMVLSREGDNEPKVQWMNRRRGNRWRQAAVDYNSARTERAFRFLFHGVVGRSSAGDIALDDISILRGTCASTAHRFTTTADPSVTTPPTRSPSTTVRPPPTGPEKWSGMPLCTFENKPSRGNQQNNGNTAVAASGGEFEPYIFPEATRNDEMCGWINVGQFDQFDWIRHSGSTPSTGTGPTRDRTNRRGYYMYIESSSPRTENDAAYLLTYAMPASDYCIDMSYHMFGENTGKLVVVSIQRSRNGTRLRTTLREVVGSKGNRWRNLKVNFDAAANLETVRFRLEGIVGDGSKSDIAIDDTAILPGRCNACSNPTHRTSSSPIQTFAAGCVNTELFYVRCCSSSQPKAVYRRVRNCNANIFTTKRLRSFCQD